jgi:hypothetical protein
MCAWQVSDDEVVEDGAALSRRCVDLVAELDVAEHAADEQGLEGHSKLEFR